MKPLLRLICPIVFFHLFVITGVIAQKKLPACGWDQIYKNNPTLLKQIQASEKKFNSLIQRNQINDADSLYTIPVVVHVIHTGTPIGAPDNPADELIYDMLSVLNDGFRKNGPLYGGADIRMQFQLALRSPACGATTGINRINGSAIPNYVSGGIAINTYPGSADEVSVKNLSRWPNTDYINIWVVNKIQGNSMSPGGFAYFAESNEAFKDGIVMNANFVNGDSKTIVHEMGHVFELYHTFYDDAWETNCPRVDSCVFYGDRICDTEPSKLEYDCNNTTNICTGNPYVVADPSYSYSVLHNYMNYTDCPWMFTQNQKSRMRAALHAFRPGLLSSAALSASPVLAPTAACIPSASFALSQYYGVERVEFNTLNVYSNSSHRDGSFYNDRICNQRTTVYQGQTYTLRITGSYENPHAIKAFLDYNNDGDFTDAGELLLTDYQSIASVAVTIPSTGIPLNVPLRLRIVADNPAPGYPTFPAACQLNGTAPDGSGQVEDFSVVVASRQVVSVASGPWNNPATWSCNCVPLASDHVVIKAGHAISITPAMGLIQCDKITIEPGSTFNVSGNFRVNR